MLAAHIVAGNDDLLTEILLRLPIKSLLRFKSVSTHWLSLISNTSFSLLRSSHIPNPPPISGLFLHRSSRNINDRFESPEFDFVPVNDDDDDIPEAKPLLRPLNFFNDPCGYGITIIQSCNGLLLLCHTNRGHTCNFKFNYYIYNPTTNKFITLPHPYRRVFRYLYGIKSVSAVNIAFDPSKSSHYKAVCVYISKGRSRTLPQRYEIQIYSSETGLWTPSGDPFAAKVNFRISAYWNGSIHWFSRWGESLYFNLNTESISTMPMPPMPEGWDPAYGGSREPFYGESGGHLHLIQIYLPQTTHFNVYEMERDYSNWFVKYYVDLDSIPSAFPEIRRYSRDDLDLYCFGYIVLDVVRGEKEEDSFLVLGITGKAIRYNFVDKTFNKLCDFIPDDPAIKVTYTHGWSGAFQYIESLASV